MQQYPMKVPLVVEIRMAEAWDDLLAPRGNQRTKIFSYALCVARFFGLHRWQDKSNFPDLIQDERMIAVYLGRS